MKNVIVTKKVSKKIYKFFEYYKLYYENFYEDSWIWSENIIINNYIQEAKDRKQDMLNKIKNTLWNESVSYPNNTAVIRWKTKFLIIQISEIENTRIVEDIEIR